MDVNNAKNGTSWRQLMLSLLLCTLVLLIFTSTTSVFEYFDQICIENIECPETGEKSEFDKENKLDDYIQSNFNKSYQSINKEVAIHIFNLDGYQIFTENSDPPPEQLA